MEGHLSASLDYSEEQSELVNSVRHNALRPERHTPVRRRRRQAPGREITAVRKVKWPFPAFVLTYASGALVLLGVNNALVRLYVDLRMLRGVFLLVLLPFMFLINLKVWQRFHIDYVRLLSLAEPAPGCYGHNLGCMKRGGEPVSDDDDDDGGGGETASTGSTPSAVGGVTSVLATLWIATMLIVIYTAELQGPVQLSRTAPFALWILVVAIVCNPFPVLYQRSRQWLCYVLWRIVAAPFYPVRFVDTWVADQMTSLTLVLLDFEYTVCLLVKVQWLGGYLDSHDICLSPTIGIRQILGVLPSWFRLAQCFRAYYDTRRLSHLINAGKYFSTFPMVIAASFVADAQQRRGDFHSLPVFYIWLALALIHAVYVFSWDVIMDWGLLRPNPVNNMLRPCLLYGRRWVYYVAIVLDMILRFGWTMKMSVSVSSWFGSDMLLLLLGAGEVLRRCMWNFFRVEHEQIKQLEALHLTDSRPSSPFSGTSLSDMSSPSFNTDSDDLDGDGGEDEDAEGTESTRT